MEKISFIPQKENRKVDYHGQGPGLIILFSGIMLAISLLAFGGTFLYKNLITKQVKTLEQSLERTKSSFDDPFISELNTVSSKIELGKKLINEHGYLGGLFVFLEKNTLKNVALTSFDYSGSEEVRLGGIARNYTSVANQAKSYKEDSNVEDVDVSGLTLGEGGVVSFEALITFSPSFFSYLSPNNK